MDFRITINRKKLAQIIANFLTALLTVVRNYFLLIVFPYKTVRKISADNDQYQLIIIFGMIFLYFKFIYYLRGKPYPATLLFLIFVINFLITVSLFYWLSKPANKIRFSSFIFTFSYSLLPTLTWFVASSLLYVLLPPPRTISILGRGFSIFFLAFSLSLLAWKLILVYLSLRFSSRLGIYRILYMMFLYMLWFIPCTIFLYHFKLFRVPFI